MNLTKPLLLLAIACNFQLNAHSDPPNSPDYSITLNTVFECTENLNSPIKNQISKEKDFSIIPNPIRSNNCTILFPITNNSNAHFTLIDLSGNTLLQTTVSQDQPNLSLKGISTGIYIAIISNNQKRSILKLIKE